MATNKIAVFLKPDAPLRKKPYAGNSQNPEADFSEILMRTSDGGKFQRLRKSTMRLLLVPFALFATPQQFAVLVNCC